MVPGESKCRLTVRGGLDTNAPRPAGEDDGAEAGERAAGGRTCTVGRLTAVIHPTQPQNQAETVTTPRAAPLRAPRGYTAELRRARARTERREAKRAHARAWREAAGLTGIVAEPATRPLSAGEEDTDGAWRER